MIVLTPEHTQTLIEFIRKSEELAFDVETTGLNVRKDKIIGFGVSNDKESYYVPLSIWNPETKQMEEGVSYHTCQYLLKELKDKKLITWNGSFDMRFVYHFFSVDLIGSIYCDSMLLKHTVDEEPPFGLKPVAKKVFGHSATQEQEEMKASIKANGGGAHDYYKADLDLMSKYCQQDCILTFKLKQHYEPILAKEGLTKFFYEDEVMPLYREVTIPMELNGIPVDVPALEKAEAEIVLDMAKLEREIQVAIAPHLDAFTEWFLWKDYPPRRSGDFAQAIAGTMNWDLPRTATGKYQMTKNLIEAMPQSAERDFLLGGEYLSAERVRALQLHMWAKEEQEFMFNLNSTHHLKKLFFDELKEEPLSRTPKGAPQVNEHFITSLKDKYDWAPTLIKYHKLVKLHGSYIERFLKEQEDGIFYPSFQQHRTISGRYGSDLQQLPRPISGDDIVAKHNNKIRRFFISGDDHVFIDNDYESLEPHIFSHVSGDDRLRNIFRGSDDFYSTVAIKTEKIQGVSANKNAENYLGKVNKARRQKAKSYALGIPYGMSAYKLHFEIGSSLREAEQLHRDYLDSFPDLARWMKESEKQCLEQGFVRSEAGRVRHMPQAPKIWFAHGEELLDPLMLYQKYGKNPGIYKQKKFLRKKLSNYLNNSKNFQIQSLAASIVNRAAIAINRFMREQGIPGGVCLQVHDEILIRIPKNWGNYMTEKMQRIMENNYKISIPLKAVPIVAKNYGDCKD